MRSLNSSGSTRHSWQVTGNRDLNQLKLMQALLESYAAVAFMVSVLKILATQRRFSCPCTDE